MIPVYPPNFVSAINTMYKFTARQKRIWRFWFGYRSTGITPFLDIPVSHYVVENSVENSGRADFVGEFFYCPWIYG